MILTSYFFPFFSSWSGYHDELAWSAAWLYKATADPAYLSKAESFFDEFELADPPTEFSWDNKVAGVQILLFEATSASKYENAIDTFLSYVMNEAQYTPKGLIFIDQWGSLRHASNMAHACAQVRMTNSLIENHVS